MRKEAILYKKLENKVVQCQNCAHYCTIIPDQRGFCRVRKNIDGVLYSLNYAKAIAINIDPIEKKPLFHFSPGTQSLSIAAMGCNFRCAACQNWLISQGPQLDGKIKGDELLPEKIIEITKGNNLTSITYTYTEPAIFSEYALAIMKLAQKEGIKNIWITNGFWSEELFNLITPYLDAVNVDFKGCSNEFYEKYCESRLDPVLETLKRIKKSKKKIWVEITYLIIPSLNDSQEDFRKCAEFIENELGAETPVHFSKFFGEYSWKLKHIKGTTEETLKIAYNISKEVGLKYVYTGNIPGLETENTYCPECKKLAIERKGYDIKRFDKDGKCRQCNQYLNIIDYD